MMSHDPKGENLRLGVLMETKDGCKIIDLRRLTTTVGQTGLHRFCECFLIKIQNSRKTALEMCEQNTDVHNI